MAFVQIIEYRTTRIDELGALVEKYRANLPAGVGPVRAVVGKDRDRPATYLSIVEFESYESAMANSSRPDTDELARQLAALCDEPPTFRNLDVVDAG